MSLITFEGAAGNRIAGQIAGEGDQVVLFVHGGGQTRHAWEEAVERVVADGMTAISIDQRGHGDSDWIETADYRFSEYAADLAAVARSIGNSHGRAPVVVGASLGGIAAMLAEGESDGSLLEALVLVDIVPRLDHSGVARITGFMRERLDDGFGSVEEAADAVAAYLPHRKRPQSLDGLKKNLRRHHDGRYRWHWDPRFLNGPNPVGPHDAETEERLVAAVRRLSIPVLLVRGGRSELVSERHVEEFLELVPHAAYADVSDAGHMVAGDRNDAFIDAFFGFLKKH